MNSINANSLSGARAYFTGFDRHIISKLKRSEAELRKDIERDLKMLLLTKQQLVSGASTLTSTEFVYELLRDNPVLLSNNLILPALEVQKDSPLYYLGRVKDVSPHKQLEMRNFYERMYTHAIRWKLEDNAGWFKSKFIAGLTDPKGVLSRNLSQLPRQELALIIEKITTAEVLDKPLIEEIAFGVPVMEAEVIRNFRDLLYQMSGARVVNCESVLPQENYIDYSLADMEGRKTILSESQIFWKLFMELFFETISKPKLPVQILDLLSFEDIVEIREPLLQSSFTEDYEAVVRAAVEGNIGWQSGKVLLSIEELMTIRKRLAEKFSDIFDRQIGTYIKKKKLAGGQLIKSDFNVGLQYRPQAAKLDLRGSISSLLNAPTDLPTAMSVQDKTALSRLLLKRAKIENETAFVDAIKLLTDRLNGQTIS